MILAFFKGIKIELTILIVIMLTLLGLAIYKHNGTRLEQALESINRQLYSLGKQYQVHTGRLEKLEKQFFYLISLKKLHNYAISKSDINELLAQHSISYKLNYVGNRKNVAFMEIKNDQLTWVSEDFNISLSIKHELALLQLFEGLRRRFSAYIDLQNCDIKRVVTDAKATTVNEVTARCLVKLYTL